MSSKLFKPLTQISKHILIYTEQQKCFLKRGHIDCVITKALWEMKTPFKHKTEINVNKNKFIQSKRYIK